MSRVVSVSKYVEISCAHRIVAHEGKCQNLHGHNYRITAIVQVGEAALNNLGMAMDFNDLSDILQELHALWDHKTLMWDKDEKLEAMRKIWNTDVVVLQSNITAENIGLWVRDFIERRLDILMPETIYSISVKVRETEKCEAVIC